jgi:predicted RNase H-like HicB family nuclease
MDRVEVNSRVGSDGVLRLSLPLPAADANRDVRVTVEPLDSSERAKEDYRAFILRTAGAWQWDFERPATLEHWKDGELFVGRLLEAPEVFSQGETLDELLENVRDANDMMKSDDAPIQENPLLPQ